MLDDDIPLAQFAVAFEGASWKDPDSIPLMIMQAMLGSWHKMNLTMDFCLCFILRSFGCIHCPKWREH
ncbi:unnamed protein product [Trifolium pratense]|nr:unnamed protein product [Trifolium pratense]